MVVNVTEIVIKSGWHRQMAIDELVKLGFSYRQASEEVDHVFEVYSMYSDDDGMLD